MEHRQLGKDGPMVSVLGLGAWPIGGGMGRTSDDDAIATIHAALDNGVTLLDTAQMYRGSEKLLGRALTGAYRDKAFIATKASSDFTRAGIEAAMDDSLRDMGVDHVDLYQLHRPTPRVPIEEQMGTLADLKAAGKTRYLGVSNYDAAQMQAALNVARLESNQPRYNLFNRQIEAVDIPFCEREGIGILAHSPLDKGLLTGKYSADHTFDASDERATMPRFQGDTFAYYLNVAKQLEEVAQDNNATMVQLAIAWQLRLPAITCVLVGAKTPAQVEEFVGAMDVTLSDGDLDRIEAILEGVPSSQ